MNSSSTVREARPRTSSGVAPVITAPISVVCLLTVQLQSERSQVTFDSPAAHLGGGELPTV